METSPTTTTLVDTGQVVEVDEGAGHIWWAYIHSSDHCVRVKRWHYPAPGRICDLEYAKQEIKDGNSFIEEILDKPFTAFPHNRRRAAHHLFRIRGVIFNPRHVGDEQYEMKQRSLERFHNIDID